MRCSRKSVQILEKVGENTQKQNRANTTSRSFGDFGDFWFAKWGKFQTFKSDRVLSVFVQFESFHQMLTEALGAALLFLRKSTTCSKLSDSSGRRSRKQSQASTLGERVSMRHLNVDPPSSNEPISSMQVRILYSTKLIPCICWRFCFFVFFRRTRQKLILANIS